MNSTLGFAIVGALARLLRPLGLGPLAGPDPEIGDVETHEHYLADGFDVWHRHATTLVGHPLSWDLAHPGQDPDRG